MKNPILNLKAFHSISSCKNLFFCSSVLRDVSTTCEKDDKGHIIRLCRYKITNSNYEHEKK